MTRTQAGSHPDLAQLEAVLDIHGAKPSRWPDGARAGLLAFIAADESAARLFAEAEALDRLLGAAPDAAPNGLEARILAAAATLPQMHASPVAVMPRRRALVPPPPRRIWPELTLLAASLFLGLLIGLSGQALPALQDIAMLTGDDDAWGGIAGLLFDGGGQERDAL